MRLDTEFIKLPLAFDVERMRAEVEAISADSWRPHPQGHPGNSALPLISLGGDPSDDGVAGEMLPTPHLERCPYLAQVLESFETVFGRSRLMRLEGKSQATLHVDTNYYWADRVRVHVPILTSPVIEFICNDKSLHMAAGEAWIFDAWKLHNVLNPTGDQRIHLVADTVGSAAFWELVASGERPFGDNGSAAAGAAVRSVAYEPGRAIAIETERANYPVVMSPWEQRRLGLSIVADLDITSTAAADAFRDAVERLNRDWRVAWARHGERKAGWPNYRQLLERADGELGPLEGQLALTNRTDAVEIARQMLIRPALNPQLARRRAAAQPAAQSQPASPAKPAAPRVAAQREVPRSENVRRFDRPVFIVAPPRSGTSVLFEAVARAAGVYTIGGESHAVIESIDALQPANRGWDSNRLTATDASPAIGERLRDAFLAQLRDRDGEPAPESGPVRMLEKTPKNSLRIPFLDALFPGALWIYLYRDPRESLASMVEAWESGRFVTYRDLPGWPGPPWSLLLTPEWRNLAGSSLVDTVTGQWTMATRVLNADLERIEPGRVHTLEYGSLVADPRAELTRIAEFAELEFDREIETPLPLSRHTVSPPDPQKWRRLEAELGPALARVGEVRARARSLVERQAPAGAEQPAAVAPGAALRSVHTGTFPEILGQLSSSLLVTTYQTGKLICARHTPSGLNTHFRNLDMPMGRSRGRAELAVGTRSQVCEYRNVPEVAPKLEPARERTTPASCRAASTTPATSASTTWPTPATSSGSSAPASRAWRRSTTSTASSRAGGRRSSRALAAEDRCHLNGLAVVDDEVRYVTALGDTDTAGGWRENKARAAC